MGYRGLLSGVSGLQSHSTWLDVIGNNLSNMNTVAYKSSRVLFSDQISQTLSAGSGPSPSSARGGVNPQQAGLGTRISSIQTLFNPGPTLQTGNAYDIALKGEGFLMAQKGTDNYFTRSGNLSFDADGTLVDANGGLIQGYMARAGNKPIIINSVSDHPPQPLAANDASFVLDTSNKAEIGAIRIPPDLTIPAKPTTEVKFIGNLDSLQSATAPGGILDLAPNGQPMLPVGGTILLMGAAMAIDGTRLTDVPTAGGGFMLKEVTNLSAAYPGTTIAVPIENGGINLGWVMALRGGYAWEQTPPVPPAVSVSQTVYDSLGAPRELTIHFYQVLDIGDAGINSVSGPSQVCYAWYAFDTSGGASVNTDNIIGGTGISEGDYWGNYYDRGTNRDLFIGDFIYFNTDGSLANSGCAGGPVPTPPGIPNYMTNPRVYMPPYNYNPPTSPIPTMGADILPIEIDFGSYGYLTQGRRDGLYSDAAGSWEIKNGVNTYIPNHSVHVDSQNGYPEGTLEKLNIDQTGVLNGSFSNGRIVSLAQLALARVDNPGGLIRGGDGAYRISNNSGAIYIGLPGSNGLSTIQSYALEGSNVDTAVELSNMIIAQRGFEANGRTISTESENSKTLANMGR